MQEDAVTTTKQGHSMKLYNKAAVINVLLFLLKLIVSSSLVEF